jgi:hypothetical protein
MDSSYIKLASGSRIDNYMGLKMDEGYSYKHGKNYLFIQIPASVLVETSDKGLEEPTMVIKRNQHVFLAAACTLNVRGQSFLEVEANPALAEFGQVQSIYRIHPDSGEQRPGVWFTARKDTDISTLDFLINIYMVA